MAGPKHRSAICAQLRQVALRGRMLPHLTVHGRRDQQWTTRQRTRQTQQAEQIIGTAMQQFGQKIGACRCNQNRIGLARQIDMRHVVGRAVIPLVAVHSLSGQRLQGHGRDELLGRSRHHHLHLGPQLDQQPQQFRRLVAGNPAAQAQQYLAPLQYGHSAVQLRDNSEKFTSTRTALP
jgi:hypothetical protein